MLNINDLPGQSTFEMQITSGKFQADLFTMTNDTEFTANATYDMPAAEHLVPNASGEVVLAHIPIANTTYIKGLTQRASGDLESGEWKFKGTDTDLNKKTICFFIGNTGTTDDDVAPSQAVEILYRYEVAANEAKIDNKSAAIGEAILVYPVYTSSDECSIDSSIRGYVILKVYRARVTSQPGLDGSYKTASTFQFTLSTVDPKRDDGNAYSIAYIQN